QHCRVVLYNVREQNRYHVVGILDGDPQKAGTYVGGIPILGNYDRETLDRIQVEYDVHKFFISFGAMKYRKAVFEYMVGQGWTPVNIIHPDAVISSDARIGKGVLIECGCLITPNPVIGDNVVVNTGSQVNHDNVVEDHVYIASGVVLSGGVTIKQNTLIDDGVIVTLGTTVGENCIIGAGAVVTKDIEDHVICYGNPARVIRPNDKY
ncbi:MAG: NeuD/PglB/VioB family sugar acetyltransferase, partial [Lachnospiraceae bacterium]|nr:NeuD/PglB/VioB family sugar acetyltransferase [Lachnospiraceae bacterium]